MFIDEVFAPSGGLATREQLLSVMSPKTLVAHVKKAQLFASGMACMRCVRQMRSGDSQGWI